MGHESRTVADGLSAAQRDALRSAMVQQINLTTAQVNFLTKECQELRQIVGHLDQEITALRFEIRESARPWWYRLWKKYYVMRAIRNGLKKAQQC